MKGSCAPFEGKKITLMGLGLLGRGVGDAEFLAGCGAHVLVTDKKTEEQLAESIAQLKKYPNITFHLGGHAKEDFTQCDMVLKAAGVPLDSPEIAAAQKAGVPVYMSTALFAKYAAEVGAKIVGVTGTRGKSTVSSMIYHTLKRFGKQTHLGGNVRGKSTLATLPEIKKGDVCVLELDSWQLQGFGDLHISPHIAVFTNLMPDHMNYYGSDPGTTALPWPGRRAGYRAGMEEYFADKANIFVHQKTGNLLFVGSNVQERVKAARPPILAAVPPAIPADWQLKVVGEHNRENASLAVAALRALGLSESEIKSGLESFEPVEGRLQLVRELKGVNIYNDNNATTPEATIAALHAVGGNKNVVLIMGGADKALGMGDLISEIKETCKAVFLLAGSGTDRIKAEMRGTPVFKSLKDATRAAVEAAAPGNVILFSPAFASFGMFKNEYDRNDQFVELVWKLNVDV